MVALHRNLTTLTKAHPSVVSATVAFRETDFGNDPHERWHNLADDCAPHAATLAVNKVGTTLNLCYGEWCRIGLKARPSACIVGAMRALPRAPKSPGLRHVHRRHDNDQVQQTGRIPEDLTANHTPRNVCDFSSVLSFSVSVGSLVLTLFLRNR